MVLPIAPATSRQYRLRVRQEHGAHYVAGKNQHQCDSNHPQHSGYSI